jgi:uncharacterized sulfatase
MSALRYWRHSFVLFAVLGLAALAQAADFNYRLTPRKVAEDTWVLTGKTEDFSRKNGGDIANSAFVVTAEGVVLIDTGSTRLYGEQLRAAIAKVTPKPVIKVFNTHHHPDHFLGNQAFARVSIAALGATIAGQKEEGKAFVDNIFRMAGDAAKGTESFPASESVGSGVMRIGDREFELIGLSGHTAGDLMIFDRKTGVLFAGDLVFYNRAPTTPHATVAEWQAALVKIADVKFSLMVPGHGEPVRDGRAIEQTQRYLAWVESSLREAVEQGVEMAELLSRPVPAEFSGMPLSREEFARSIAHLYRRYEANTLQRTK